MRILVMPSIVALLSASLASGCFLLAAPAVEQAGQAGSGIGSAGGGISHILSAQSSKQLNASLVEKNNVQADYYKAQMSASSRNRQRELAQRATSVGILQTMAKLNNDPQLADLANWVKAGGNPQFALGYGMTKEKDDAARARAATILEKMSAARNDPQLYDLARWVRAGGNQKFALDYALTRSAKSKPSQPEAAPLGGPQGPAF